MSLIKFNNPFVIDFYSSADGHMHYRLYLNGIFLRDQDFSLDENFFNF